MCKNMDYYRCLTMSVFSSSHNLPMDSRRFTSDHRQFHFTKNIQYNHVGTMFNQLKFPNLIILPSDSASP